MRKKVKINSWKKIKVLFYSLIAILFIFGLFISWMAYEGGKDFEEFEKSKKIRIDLKNKRKAYMDNIATISLFGVHFQDDVRNYVLSDSVDDNGLFIGKKIDDGNIPLLQSYSIEIVPPNKNENFIEYYAYYNPFSYEIFTVVGVLPKKFSDFVDNQFENNLGLISNISDYERNKAFKKCKEYLEPFLSIIDDGIKAKTNLVADDKKFIEFYKRKKGFRMIYRMNSGLNDGWDFDGYPETYFNIKSEIPKFITKKDHREPIISLEASCNNYSNDPNINIALSQDILRGYMITDLDRLFHKKAYENKLKKEKKLLELNKKKINKSGLQ